MKKVLLDPRELMSRPAVRELMGYLLRHEDAVRVKAAREDLHLSIAQIGLAMRALERHGLAQRRNIVVEGDERRLPHLFFEATDVGREQGPIWMNLAPLPPTVTAAPRMPEPARTAV